MPFLEIILFSPALIPLSLTPLLIESTFTCARILIYPPIYIYTHTHIYCNRNFFFWLFVAASAHFPLKLPCVFRVVVCDYGLLLLLSLCSLHTQRGLELSSPISCCVWRYLVASHSLSRLFFLWWCAPLFRIGTPAQRRVIIAYSPAQFYIVICHLLSLE